MVGLDRCLALATQGVPQESLLARLAPRNVQYSPGDIRRVVRDGISYELDMNDFMEWMVYFGIGVEPRGSLLALVRPGMTVLDVGANIGEVSMKLAQAVGPGGQVISFEPGKAMFQKFTKTLAMNGFPNVKPVNMGLGDQAGEFQLVLPCPTNRGGSRVAQSGGETIQVGTLDDFLVANKMAKVDLIKIDVEGFERKVLGGAKATLAKHHPVLFVELADVNLKEQGDSAQELLTYLEGFGYRFMNAQTGAVVEPHHSFKGTHFDVICFSPAAS